jgi:Putative lumazine-binding
LLRYTEEPRCGKRLESGVMNIFGRLQRILLVAGVGCSALLPLSLHAATPAEQAVLAPVNALFDGMAKRDPEAMKKVLLPGGTMVLIRDGKPVQMTVEAFADRVGKPSATSIEERIHDPLVRIDHDLAVVWAPFEFLNDGKVDSCGTDLFNLVWSDGKWLIASVADTGRKDCPIK